jgi:hypothetical protein
MIPTKFVAGFERKNPLSRTLSIGSLQSFLILQGSGLKHSRGIRALFVVLQG